MEKPRLITVSLRLDIMPGREQLIGIFRHVKKYGRNWNLSLKTQDELAAEIAAGHHIPSDGYIFSETPPASVSAYLAHSTTPLVTIDAPSGLFPSSRRNLTILELDNNMIGRIGADYFHAKGRYRSFAFIEDDKHSHWAVCRRDAFRAAAHRYGIPCLVYDASNDDTLADWLNALDKPAAIMVACDRRTIRVLECCRGNGLDIPRQVALLGVDNESMYCNFTQPSLSSVDPNLEEEGFRAAHELDILLRTRRPCPRKQTKLKPGHVVERESTATVLPAALLIQKALAFIDSHAAKGITPADVAREIRVSRSLAELRFRQIHGQTIHATLTARRLAIVRKLAETTTCRIGEIVRAGGFSNRRQVERLFKQHHGMSIRAWRKEHAVKSLSPHVRIKAP
jgi:LacI family transcriptional regulator